jgi:cell division protein FtsA
MSDADPPRIERILTAIDIGSSKVAALIAGQTADGQLIALGTGLRESRGIKLGCITDIAQVDRVVRDALEQAESIAGIEVRDVWVGFGGSNLTSRIVNHEEDIGGGPIDEEDVAELLLRAREAALDDRRAILHAQTALFTLDGNGGVRNPIGLFADRLAVDIHLVEGDRGPVSNLVAAVRAAHVNIREVAATSMASGMAVLTPEQRDLGVAVIDIGAALTNIALFAGGMLVGLATLPVGGDAITDDVTSEFGTLRSHAERMKCFHGSAISSPRDHQDQIDLPAVPGAASGARITRAQLNAVIRKRLDHMVPQIGATLKSMGYADPVARQVVLVGGTAELKGMADYVQSVLGGSARIGRPMNIASLPEAHAGSAFAVAAGLVHYAAGGVSDLRHLSAGSGNESQNSGWLGRLRAIWRRGM